MKISEFLLMTLRQRCTVSGKTICQMFEQDCIIGLSKIFVYILRN